APRACTPRRGSGPARRRTRRCSPHDAPAAPSGQKELAVPGDHRTGGVVLPGDDTNVGDAAPELEDLGARSRRRRTRRAQVIAAEGDRLRAAFTAPVVGGG